MAVYDVIGPAGLAGSCYTVGPLLSPSLICDTWTLVA